MGRFTKKNPVSHPSQKQTYRVPIERAGEFAIKTFGRFTDISGELIDKLGAYEDLGEPEAKSLTGRDSINYI